MIVYLADLSHDPQRPAAVPLASGYLAVAAKARFPGLDIRIFVDPHALLDALRDRPPAILGLSLHLWSERLSAFCAEQARRLCPETVVVVGGPSVPRDDHELTALLLTHSCYDFAVPGEGEAALVNLIAHLRATGTFAGDSPLDGCAYLGADGALRRGRYLRPDLADVPSPYLTGWLDPFLAEGYTPVIQSSRGCPYSCTFCVSGAAEWSKLRPFPLERVYAELAYVQQRSGTGDSLILTDENLGIFGDRDVQLARHLREMHDTLAWPRHLYAYTAKLVTPHVRAVVEALGPLGEFCQSFQTLEDGVRRAIGRTNQHLDAYLANLAWAKDRGILASTEMIFGLPGETAASYLAGLEWLLRSGVDRVYSYNLKLLNGTVLATQASRQRHGYRTLWRLPDRAYGRYDGQVVAEAEEVVVGSDTFDWSDYLAMRRYGLWLELASGRGYLTEFMRTLTERGLPGEKLIAFLSAHDFATYPWLRMFATNYDVDARGELFDSPDACRRYAEGLLAETRPAQRAKLNLIYAEKMMASAEVRGELLEVLKEFVQSRAGSLEVDAALCEYVDDVMADHLERFQAKEYV